MSTLLEVQSDFASAVIGGEAVEILPLIVDDTPGATGRVAIYANHYRLTLIDALATTYPVTLQLVGDAFFRGAARRYVRETPPVSPCLFEYGASLPAFLASLPDTAGLPYLADVARLEWAINAAWHAPDPLPEHRNGRGAAGLRLHPACRLVTSPFAVDQVWQAHQDDGSDLAAIDVNAGPVHLLVGRLDDDAVGWIRLSAAEAAFAAGLIASGDALDSLAAAHAIDASFVPVPFLAALIENGFAIPNHHDLEEEMDR